jgi:hypothetical protein
VTGHYELPDVVDAWGNPLLGWMQDDVPGTPPFAARDSSTRGWFYWNSNSGFLKSTMLGKSQLNQRTDSLLGSDQNAPDLIVTLRGVLGHPGFPDTTPPPNALPLAARGKLVLQSAGPNGIYLGVGERGGKIANNGLPPGHGIIKYAAGQDPLDNFDDLISTSGN